MAVDMNYAFQFLLTAKSEIFFYERANSQQLFLNPLHIQMFTLFEKCVINFFSFFLAAQMHILAFTEKNIPF